MPAAGQAQPASPVDLTPLGGEGLARAGRAVMIVRPLALPILLAAALLVVWEQALRIGHMSPLLFASPGAVWQTLVSAGPTLLNQMVPTLAETVGSFVLAAGLGIVLGTLLTLSGRVRQALFPHILLFQVVPKVAVATLFIIWLRPGPADARS